MKVCNKQDFFEWIKVTEAHPNKYYFERIDVFDNALVRSFLPPTGGRGHFSVVKSTEDRWPLSCGKTQNS